MFRISRWLVLLCLSLQLPASGQATGADQDDSGVASALLQRFESIFQASGKVISVFKTEGALPDQDMNLLRIPFIELLNETIKLRKDRAGDMLNDVESIYVGARNFRSPAGVGMVRYDFCYVMVYAPGSSFDLANYLRGFPLDSSNGLLVWEGSRQPLESNPERGPVYFTKVGSRFVLAANNMEEIRAMARLMSSRPTKEAALDLRTVNGHAIWGYRKYGKGEVPDKMAGGVLDVSPDAKALEFYAEIEKKEGVVRFLSSSGDVSATRINERMPTTSPTPFPKLKQVSPGTWEARFSLADEWQALAGVATVMYLFGFGVYP